jgi:hypothetical protein
MIKVHNNVENKIVFKGNERDFIDFVKKIVIENEDYYFTIIGLSDAKEYIEEYCDNLEWEEIIPYSLEWFQTLPYQIIDKMFNTNLSRFLVDEELTEEQNNELQLELMSVEDVFMGLTEDEVKEKYRMVDTQFSLALGLEKK